MCIQIIACIYIMTQNPIVLIILALPSVLSAAPPPRLEIKGASENEMRLTAEDRSNGTWALETSTDLMHWTRPGITLNVRNSVLPVPAESLPPGTYYRLASLPAKSEKTKARMLNLPATPYTYSAWGTPPSNLTKTISSAIINDKKATLGRVLFYDRRVSRDNSVSCASCHQPERAFADGVSLSSGHLGGPTIRNSVSLQHARTYSRGGGIFWDGRGKTLDTSVLEPISHPVEMGLSLADLTKKIYSEPYYQELFVAAYESSVPSPEKVGECLADFIEAMASFRSKYDTASVTAFANFTAEETAGRSIFSQRCASCHPVGTFTTGAFANNGLELQYQDPGLAALSGLPSDEGKFRTPSLRQVALTAPYMHDGRFATLREVIDFYDHGVTKHPNLTKPLTGTAMNLKETEKQALEAFLKTLTDTSVQENPAFSDPFRTD